jgi:putative hydrolase of the HAD superfamily
MRKYFLTISLENYEVILLDLDNTIYDENTFLIQVYKNICSKLPTEMQSHAFKYMWGEYLKHGREDIIQKFVVKFQYSGKISQLIDIYRTGSVKLSRFRFIESLLSAYQSKIYIFTNGNVQQQENKLRALNLLNHKIIYAKNYGSKPNTKVISTHFSHIEISDICMIGDSEVDKLFAVYSGCDFYKVNFSRGLDGFIDEGSLKIE